MSRNGQPSIRNEVGLAALQARLATARGEFVRAREVLSQALETYPQEEYLWILLSYALLKEGRDWAEAERVLLKILELEPTNAEAKQNLEVLRNNRQRGYS